MSTTRPQKSSETSPQSQEGARQVLMDRISTLSAEPYQYTPGTITGTPPEKGENWRERTERRRFELLNEQLATDIKLKERTLNRLFWFLGLETVVIFILSIMQATQLPADFHLEEWSYRTLVGATITQITLVLKVAVEHLFPKSRTEPEPQKPTQQNR